MSCIAPLIVRSSFGPIGGGLVSTGLGPKFIARPHLRHDVFFLGAAQHTGQEEPRPGSTLCEYSVVLQDPFFQEDRQLPGRHGQRQPPPGIETTLGCMVDDQHAPHLLCELHRRQEASAEAAAMNGQSFKKCTTFGNLDADWLVSWLTEVSDLFVDNIVKAKEHDGEAVQQLAIYALHYPAGLRLPQAISLKPVARRVFMERLRDIGTRPENFKQGGGLTRTGALDWRNGCFTLQWTEDQSTVKSIFHRSGATAEVPAHAVITKQHLMYQNWSDLCAYVEMPPMPQIRLADFFKAEGTGPHAYKTIGCQSKDFANICQRHRDAWGEEQDQLVDNSSKTDDTSTKLQELQQKQKEEALKKARTQAKASVAQNKRRRTIALTS